MTDAAKKREEQVIEALIDRYTRSREFDMVAIMFFVLGKILHDREEEAKEAAQMREQISV